MRLFLHLNVIHILLYAGTLSAQTYKAYYNAGIKAMQQGDYYAATEYFLKALEFDKDDLQLKYNMAEASRLFNDINVAAYWYNQTILHDKDNRYPKALFHLAMMNKMKGEYEVAKNQFYRYYTRHASDSDYYSIRARKELDGCELAWQLKRNPLKVNINRFSNTINTIFSDFGAVLSDDSTLYFSSLRFELKDPKRKKITGYHTRLLASSLQKGQWSIPKPLDTTVNHPALHTANLTFSSDSKWMVFTRCTSITRSEMRCELYASQKKAGRWQTPVRLPENINMPGYTSTHPALAVGGAEGYTLYFASDRPGGFGQMDLWKSEMTADGIFSPPVNLGPVINTEENEITPFFNDYTQTLYFSSDRADGLGGYDIFYSSWLGNDFSTPVNAGYPINSSYHDLYFTADASENKGMFTSNREGSLFIKSRTCCYDLWEYEIVPRHPPLTDTLVVLQATAEEKETPNIKQARSLLPLVLYFDNDQPDPRSMKTETSFTYDELYREYLKRKEEYLREYSAGLSGEKKRAAEMAIMHLFEKHIIAGYQRLDSVARLLHEELTNGKRIKLVIRGQTSPLASESYNNNLSKRRISSLVNYLMGYGNRSLEAYQQKGTLVIEWQPVGKSLAPPTVSDDLYDLRNSVYSPEAALERKIELIDVKID
jgi:tetratricopeptide (TPR) repeat protein